MIRCVHCAEEIQEEAAVCRHCGRMVPAGATTITNRGQRYGIGMLADGYGVWDLTAGGPPLARYDRDETGWGRTWAHFQQAESGGIPAPPGAAPVAVAVAPTNGKAIAAMVLGIVWVWGIGSILALIFGFLAKSEIDASAGRQSGRGMAIAGIVLGFVGLGILLIAIIAISVAAPSYPYDF